MQPDPSRSAAAWLAAGPAALLTLAFFVAGLTAPDLDLAFGLGHRSALTHSVLPVALAGWRAAWRPAACGLAGGSGVHLTADCFPNAMIGYATVKLPFAGALDWEASYAWLALNAVAAFAAALLLLRRIHMPAVAAAVAVAAALAAVTYLWRTDGGWPVLAVAVLATGMWLRRRLRPRSGG